MRLSADPFDPGYRADHADYDLFLDGVKLDDPALVYTVDDAAGVVISYPAGANLWRTANKADGRANLTFRNGLVEIVKRA
ncbi:hypothetical protein A1351_23300 [Methylosinus sp. R-45379]|uniref:hypothetical protein n=1 Tax=Methylosinus sp. R-45379 TaxID=980563 RepID=UPI0007C8B48C|nr:hypothetical protein [Methylosinus sp. R-45379]OAI29766.1 hypothetical protein A1351_23300 [Methylosinus sp. R-45379]